MNTQLKKGLLEFSILAVLRRGDSYGYQIIKDVEAVIEISESTLYPILKRLEKQAAITSYSEAFNNRLRRYYHLTPVGEREIDNFLIDWQSVEKIYTFIEESKKDE